MLNINAVVSISIDKIVVIVTANTFLLSFKTGAKGTKTCVGGYLVKTSVTAANNT